MQEKSFMHKFQANHAFCLRSFPLLLSLLIILSCNILKADEEIHFYVKGDYSQTIVVRHEEQSEYTPLKLKEFKDLCFSKTKVKYFSQLWQDIIDNSEKSELIQEKSPAENCKIIIIQIEKKLKDIFGMDQKDIDDYHISIAVLNNFNKEINKRAIEKIISQLQNFEEALNQNKCHNDDTNRVTSPSLFSTSPPSSTSILAKKTNAIPTPLPPEDLSATFLQISPEQKNKGITNRVFGDEDPFGVSYYNRRVYQQYREKYPGEKSITYIQSNFPPSKSFKIQGKDFRISKIFIDEQGREFAIIYPRLGDTEETAIMLYRSNSAGVWRFTPMVIGTQDLPHYTKGGLHYTQQQKPHEDIVIQLQEMTKDHNLIENNNSKTEEMVHMFYMNQSPFYYIIDAKKNSDRQYNVDIFYKSVSIPELESFTKVIAGTSKNKSGSDGYQDFTEMTKANIESNVFPKFDKGPTKEYHINHTYLKDVKVEVFAGSYHDQEKNESRPIEWHFARSTENPEIVWIERVNFKDSAINILGGREEVIDSGFLTSKPFEYKDQIFKEWIEESNKVKIGGYEYYNISPHIQKLPVIKEFIKHSKK